MWVFTWLLRLSYRGYGNDTVLPDARVHPYRMYWAIQSLLEARASSRGFSHAPDLLLPNCHSSVAAMKLPRSFIEFFYRLYSLIAKVLLLETFVGRVAMSVISVAFAVFSKREECI